MQAYKAYPKEAVRAAARYRQLISGDAAPSILDVSKWGQWWESGAKELEKTSPGKLITAPIRLPAAVVSSTQKTVEAVPGVIKSASYTLPIAAVAAVIIGSAFLVYKFKGEKENEKKIISWPSPSGSYTD